MINRKLYLFPLLFALLLALSGPALSTASDALHFTRRPLGAASQSTLLVGVADFDDDGDTDTLASRNNAAVWFENDGAPRPAFAENAITGGAGVGGPGCVGDFDGDGRSDFAARRGTDIVWFRNEGGTPLSFACRDAATSIGQCQDLRAADLNGDGRLDLLAALWSPDRFLWLENAGGGAFTSHTIALDGNWPWRVAAGDLDGDGDTDVLGSTFAGMTPLWFESDGAAAPSFSRHEISEGFAAPPAALAAADLNRDGRLDIAIGSHGLSWLTNDGAAPLTFTRGDLSVMVGMGAVQMDIVPADLDRDGDLDLVSSYAGEDAAGPGGCVN
jgi:hypothetical protein